MNIKKIEIVNELLTEQLNHWLLYSLALAFWGMASFTDQTISKPHPFLWFFCGLFPPVYFFLRRRVKRFFPLILLHLAAAALVCLLPIRYPASRFLCIVCCLGYLIYSLVLRLKHDTIYTDALHLPVGVVFFALSMIFNHYVKIKNWDNYYVFPLVACVVIFLITSYLERYLYFLATNAESAGVLPAGEIFHSGMGLVLAYSLPGAALLLLVSQFEWLAGLLRPVKDFLLQLLRFLVSLLPASGSEEELPPVPQQPPGSLDQMEMPADGGVFWLWKVLEFLFLAGGVCIILLAVGILLFKLIQFIRQHLVLHSSGIETTDFGDAVDIREKCGLEIEKEKRRRNPFRSLSHRERIRKLYREKLLALAGNDPQKKALLEQYTAREWERRLAADGMAPLYEQARYSPHEVTKTDVKKMKERCKAIETMDPDILP